MTRISSITTTSIRAICTVAALGFATTACMGGTGMSPAMTQQASAMHHFAMAVHMGELEEAQLALSRTQNAQVRSFAQQMVTDHTMGMQMEEQMAMSMHMDDMGNGSAMAGSGSASSAPMPMDAEHMQRMRAELASNPASRPVVEDHMRAMQMLQGTSGMQFDRAYMERQVAAHRYALEQIDRMMGEMHMAMGTSGTMDHGAMSGTASTTGMASTGAMNAGAVTMGTREGMMTMHMQERQMVAMHLQQAQQMVASMR